MLRGPGRPDNMKEIISELRDKWLDLPADDPADDDAYIEEERCGKCGNNFCDH
jgi:hypothetical protein